MQTFLLDTCIWSYWFDVERKQHAEIQSHLEKLPPGSRLGISIITWGEIAYGYKLRTKGKELAGAQYLQFIKAKGPDTFYIDIHVANKYGELRAILFDKYAPKDKRIALRPEQLVSPATSLELGIQENDLWITAQAVVWNLTLVTDDKLSRIREVVGDDLDIKNWAKPPEIPTRS